MGNYLSYGTLTTPAATDVLLACTPTNAEVMQTPRSSLLQTLEAGTTTLTGVGTIVLGTGGTLTGSSGGTSSVGTGTLSFAGSGGGTVTLGDPINGLSLIGQSQYTRPALSAATQLYFTTGDVANEYNTGSSQTGPIELIGGAEKTSICALVWSHGFTSSQNFDLVAQIQRSGLSQTPQSVGFFMYESASGKGYNIEPRFVYGSNAAGYWLIQYDNTGSYAGSSSVAAAGVEATQQAFWIKFRVQSERYQVFISCNGMANSWTPLFPSTYPLTDLFTVFPDMFGIAVCNANASAPPPMYLWYLNGALLS